MQNANGRIKHVAVLVEITYAQILAQANSAHRRFELTEGQRKAIAEITADMAREVPMNRLLQGDVGSGKTVVAVYAMLAAVAHGYQAAMMAPTEVLARQHALTLKRLLAGSQVRLCPLIGGLSAAARREALGNIAGSTEGSLSSPS